MQRFLGLFWTGVGLAYAAAAPSGAVAADLTFFDPTPLSSGFEVRGGIFAHSSAALEPRSADINFEFLSPRLTMPIDSRWTFLVPRLQFGGMLNSAGKTSYAYAGFAWQLDVTPKFFLEPMFGGAIHNGALDTINPTQISLGCRELFHSGISGGYRLDNNWSVLLTFDHISNANLCRRNIGLSTYGAKIGYRF
jgi:lipid A 3-O-deacylase